MSKSKLYTLVLTKSGKETVYMTDTLPKVKARKKTLLTSQRKQRNNYSIRDAHDHEEKYLRPPSFNFDPSGDAGSKKYLNRKARAKRIKQKNPRKMDRYEDSTFMGDDHINKVMLVKCEHEVYAVWTDGSEDSYMGEYDDVGDRMGVRFIPSNLLLRSTPDFQKWVDKFAQEKLPH